MPCRQGQMGQQFQPQHDEPSSICEKILSVGGGTMGGPQKTKKTYLIVWKHI